MNVAKPVAGATPAPTTVRAVDPITLAVLRGAFEQVAEEMDTVLAASAVSPVIADAWDRASGIFHPATGEVIAQGSTGLPIFIVVMQHTVQEVLKSHPADTMKPGDVFIVNDPYRGGTHTMDVKFVQPFFKDGRLLAIVANTGHWPDVGGMTPGGFTPVSTDIYQEGLRFPPVRLYDGGKLNEALVEVMLANMRVAEDRRGDMAAQLNALDLGCRRLDELFGRYGETLIFAAIDELKARSEQLMRQHIAEIPDGTYHVQDWMDSDGVDPDPVLIDLVMTVAGSEITFDLSGSAPACRGPFNAPYSSTMSALMIGVKHVFVDVPINAGCFVPFKIVAPVGNMFNPLPPAPVSGTTTETSQRLVGATMAALAQAVPDLVPAGAFGTGTNIGMGGYSPSKGRYATIFFFGGGYGAYADQDGLTNGSAVISASRNSSVEVLEQSVPILFTRYAMREGSAGDGAFRGGFGVEIDFELRDGDAYLTLVADRGRFAPQGVAGGGEGAKADHWFHTGGQAFQTEHLTKIDRLYLKPGDGVRLKTPGGGGYGDPAARDPELRRLDEADGLTEG
ncbi:hydantoinase B/oxoprolinase family protein [Chelatococcus reniformis]|uniref:Methylhydantoinase n=1 Tax=Chelatococcus reniformis TaxID=1494448 RepID=A0A916XDN2_9HYPH|nr:hydantoinase B/oxoprolinase family protein [Chelatococcus reniformis]GGC66255.1 methylhydantoinase [Chelatococcus reniformis]